LTAPKLVSFTTKGDSVRVVLQYSVKNGVIEQAFAGRVTKDGKKVVGVMGGDVVPSAAYLAPTDLKALDAKDVTHKLGVEEMDKAAQLSSAALPYRLKAQQTKDADEKAKLLKQAAEADKVAAIEVPKLYREVIAKHGGSYVAGRAALQLLQNKNVEAT